MLANIWNLIILLKFFSNIGRVDGREFSAATTTLMIFLKVLDEFNQ